MCLLLHRGWDFLDYLVFQLLYELLYQLALGLDGTQEVGMRWEVSFCISAASADHRAMFEEEGLYELHIHLSTGRSLQSCTLKQVWRPSCVHGCLMVVGDAWVGDQHLHTSF